MAYLEFEQEVCKRQIEWPRPLELRLSDVLAEAIDVIALQRRESEAIHRSVACTVGDAYRLALLHFPLVSIHQDVMAGSPCMVNTRIPVYMVLGALEEFGSFEAVAEQYSRLSIDHVRQAVGFARMIVECPVEHETAGSAG